MAERARLGRPRRLTLLLALAGFLVGGGAAAQTENVRTIPTRPGVTQAFLLLQPANPAVVSVILFAGGHGRLNLTPAGMGWGGGNFLVRTRRIFVDQGFLVAVVDAPSDRGEAGLFRFRTSAAHAEDVKAVIVALRGMADVPVWLVGTSMGTVSAANAAARLRDGGPDGLVLTSSVMRFSRQMAESLDDIKMKDIRVPALVVHHRHDGCPSTQYQDAVALVTELRQAPRRELLTFEGGDPPRSGPCEAHSAHGFLGLERSVVEAIAAWIKATPK